MGLSEMLSKAAKAEAERRRRIDAEEQAIVGKEQRKKVWDAFNAVCDYVPRGTTEQAAKAWADLLMAACAQLKIAGEMGRLDAVRYGGSDRLCSLGMEAAYRVCRLACVGELGEVRSAFQVLIESAKELDSPFRLFMECVRDNRRWWTS